MTSTLTVPLRSRASSTALDFEALYRAARDDVYAYVATLLRDRAAAEDVTAAAFERAYRKQRTFRADRGTARAWLFGIARNAALDELRRRKRTVALVAEPAETAAPDDPADVEREAGRGLGGEGAQRRAELGLELLEGLRHRRRAPGVG